MKKIILFTIALFFFVFSRAQQPKQADTTAAKFPSATAYANSKFTYKIINAAEKTYGYDVYADSRLMIHQTSIPAMPGNKGFVTKADAEKVAKLVIDKIKRGEMPPTVSIEEMKKLKAIN